MVISEDVYATIKSRDIPIFRLLPSATLSLSIALISGYFAYAQTKAWIISGGPERFGILIGIIVFLVILAKISIPMYHNVDKTGISKTGGWLIILVCFFGGMLGITILIQWFSRLFNFALDEGVQVIISMIFAFPIAGFAGHWLIDKLNELLPKEWHLHL